MIELSRLEMMLKTDWKAERMVERMPRKISRMEEMRFVRPSRMEAMVVVGWGVGNKLVMCWLIDCFGRGFV